MHNIKVNAQYIILHKFFYRYKNLQILPLTLIYLLSQEGYTNGHRKYIQGSS